TGPHCEVSACLARGGYEVAYYEGDTGGGYSYCELHAQYLADQRAQHSGNAKVIAHVCDEHCDHTESEWI
ncbi:hypothetical protein, partial [Streptococcus pneumoniae]|uniref:hypothetical protein n=1 Tax=Streptococcus pneumoniae TaxID=1313 RepID=UPI001E4230F4